MSVTAPTDTPPAPADPAVAHAPVQAPADGVDVSEVVIPAPVLLGGLWVVGDPAALALAAVAVVGSRTSSPFARRVAEVAVGAASQTCDADSCEFAAPLAKVALWVRLSPAGAERTVVSAAAEAGVPVVAWCSSGPDLPPAKLVSEVVASGGALCSVTAPGGEATEGSAEARDRAVATAPAAVLGVDGTLEASPDTLALLATAADAGTPLVVARPRKGHRRGADAHLSQVLAGAKRISKLGWPAAAVAAVSRFDPPAHSVCDDADEVVTSLGFWWRWGSTPDLAGLELDVPDVEELTATTAVEPEPTPTLGI